MKFRSLLVFVLSTIFVGGSAFAYDLHKEIRCESKKYKHKKCDIGFYAKESYLKAQHSQADCIKNVTWWTEGRFVHVDEGCRATFDIYGDSNDPTYAVRCESGRFGKNICYAHTAIDFVEIEREISSGRCMQGYSWYYDKNSITVKKRCKAIFRVWPTKRP